MRNIFLFMMVSLDGYFEGPNHDIRWHHVDREFDEFSIKQLSEIDTILFGRVTYEMMAHFWPSEAALKNDPVVAKLMNGMPKIVVSKTLTHTDWEYTHIINNQIKETISQLKNATGKEIAIFGSSDLTVSLIHMNLVNELRIMINPVVLGKGKRLFAGLENKLNVKLVQTRSFQNGNVLLNYQL
jgi:dihydrofolate reductase